MAARLHELYKTDVTPGLKEQFSYENAMAIPRLQKIVLSMGIGDAHDEKAKLETTMEQLSLIAGQKPAITRARRSVSNFNLRKGMTVGLKVTLRGARMYEFLDRLVTVAIPRVKDFRGLNPNGFDGRGNYSMGIAEQSIFPEIDPANITFTQGMNITMQTSAETDEEARELLRRLGMPFRES
ncbi:MAG: 50S ribosomal protein L5 [Planctomycetes bacterium]|jgi:large subunit ribosomal protein L5|nr:50S ribosomal protein L5 [Phycisphaerae bacterium]NBB96076.1 50S ribosomal protein L5 [Planctomycetota bacterium]